MKPASPLEEFMTRNLAYAIAACAAALVLSSSPAMAQPGVRIDHAPPPVPAAIEVPAGYSLFFTAHAMGTQNYICLPSPSGVAWKFLAPEATLYQGRREGVGQQVATHFLSANPDENGAPRPTWQHSFDSSRAWGRVLASSTDANFVQAGAIPWLLVGVAGAQEGPTGGSSLAGAAFVQRLNTAGGAAPATGCGQPADVGVLALVPYAADYLFYKEWPGR